MSEHSAIEWTDATWNPVRGCTKITPGCDHCYAERFSERFRGTRGHPFETGFDLTLRPERLEQPLRWRTPRMIFVNSMSDLFHKEIPQEFIARVLRNREGQPWIMRRRTTAEMDQLVRASGFEKIDMDVDQWGMFTVSIARKDVKNGVEAAN